MLIKAVVSVSFADVRHKANACDSCVSLGLCLGLYQVAEGNGPVNALAKALFRALLPTFPTLQSVVLSDYKVRGRKHASTMYVSISTSSSPLRRICEMATVKSTFKPTVTLIIL